MLIYWDLTRDSDSEANSESKNIMLGRASSYSTGTWLTRSPFSQPPAYLVCQDIMETTKIPIVSMRKLRK
jgi:hypothetical protein